ncbi:MAG: hypothetical protein K2L77_00320 [Muribaculaceae bacterium]|nr:hypothetical protein [Muribaculaceae bacterium]
MNFLAFDRLMSGRFKDLIWWTAKYTIFIFLMLWGLAWLLSSMGLLTGSWDFIHAYVDLTNPYIGSDDRDLYSKWDYAIVILINLFGMFVLNGVLLTVLVNWISNRRERFVMGEARYDVLKKSDNFVVIIGGHPMTCRLVRQLYDRSAYDYILIQSRRPVPQVRKELEALMSEKEMERVVLYAGERTSPLDLDELNLEFAKEIYIIGETFEYDGTSHDALNMKCWSLITGRGGKPDMPDSSSACPTDTPQPLVPVHVMFEYQATFNAFQATDLNLGEVSGYNFIPFSIYEIWAQQVLIPMPGDSRRYIPLDGEKGLEYDSAQRVHLVIIGMSKMGMALAIEAAHIAHYTNNANAAAGHPRTLITFIDRNAGREMQYFMGRFKELFQLARWRFVKADNTPGPLYHGQPIYNSQADMDSPGKHFPWTDPLRDPAAGSPFYGIYEPDGRHFLGDNMMDIDWEFIEGDVAWPSIQQYIRDAAADNHANFKKADCGMTDRSSRTTIAICLPVTSEATSAAMCLYDSVYEDAQQILVLQHETGALIDMISRGMTGSGDARYAKLRSFGMAEDCDYLPRIDRTIPKIIAYTYNLISEKVSLPQMLENYGAESLANVIENNWRAIGNDGPGKSRILMKWSNVYCANAIHNAIRTYGIGAACSLLPDDTAGGRRLIELLAYTEHNRWVLEQLLLGFSPVPYSPDVRWNEVRERKAALKSRMIHPDLVANDRLGSEQIYDVMIMRSIPAFLYIDLLLKKL